MNEASLLEDSTLESKKNHKIGGFYGQIQKKAKRGTEQHKSYAGE